MTKIASGVVEALKGQPLALSLVVINFLFLFAIWVIFEKIGESTERRDKIMEQVMRDCTDGRSR